MTIATPAPPTTPPTIPAPAAAPTTPAPVTTPKPAAKTGNGWMWLLWLAGIPVAYWISSYTHSRVPILFGMVAIVVGLFVLAVVLFVICFVINAVYKAVTR